MSNIKKLKHLATSQNGVLAVASIIALGWIWGSANTMQRNYELQQQVDQLDVENQLLELQTDNLQLQQAYFRTEEYTELRVREDLGLAAPGEKVIMLPRLPEEDVAPSQASTTNVQRGNVEQWIEFFFAPRVDNTSDN